MLKTSKILIKRWQEEQYYSDLFNLFLSVSIRSTLAYITAAILFAWAFSSYIPLDIFVPIMGAHALYSLIRLYYVFKYKGRSCCADEKKIFLRQHTVLMIFGSLVWGISCFSSALYSPPNYEYIMLAIVISMVGGSISTLSPLYRIFLAFNLPMLVLLALSFIYIGGEFHIYVVIILPIYAYVLMSSSWDMHLTLKKSIELKELYAKSKLELENMNVFLEDRVKKEVEYNRQKDEKMLTQSRLAQMGEMLSMIAHQWRQPLSAITATTSTMSFHLQLEDCDEVFIEDKLQRINTYVHHLSTTINDFRNFFKPDKKKSLSSLNEIVQGTFKIIGTSLESDGVIIEIFLASKEDFYTYPNELKQVLLNIIKNAQDVFIEKSSSNNSSDKIEKPRILIKTETSEDEIRLMIQDNAGGISEQNMKNIFNPYFTTKEESDGTGLGLYMSKMIVEDHCNGKIRVENLDDGACFILTFPLRNS